MARLFTCGFELQSTTSAVEFDTPNNTGLSINTTTKRSGGASLSVTASNGRLGHQVRASSTNKLFLSFWIYITAAPSGEATLAAIAATESSTTVSPQLMLESNRTVKLAYWDGAAIQYVGSASSAIPLNEWHQLALVYDDSIADNTVWGYLDDMTTAFASGTGPNAGGSTSVWIGNIDGVSSTAFLVDDVIVNDNQGSNETGLPGLQKVIILRPNAAGDSASWSRAGTDSGANYSQCNQVPPDDVTKYVQTSTLNAEDLYNMDASGINSYDTVQVVEVGGRYTRSAATSPAFKFEIEKTGSGTKTQSAAITPNSSTWKTNANAAPITSPIITYTDPDSSAWTQTTLDSMQVGVIETTDTTNNVRVSEVWSYISYTIGTPPASTVKQLAALGAG